ncbi:hypothetical protein GALL_440460 [mine drainage metagenome]|uniref:Uncharacterized protein n=1 Tax=mine drainage metagenome TaxID=410659 RepID=A0A1J5Q2T2_9ZZZZ
MGDAFVDLGQGSGPILRTQEVVDHKLARLRGLWRRSDQGRSAVGQRFTRGLIAFAQRFLVLQGQQDRLDVGILGREFSRDGCVFLRIVEVRSLQRDFGQRAIAVYIVGVLFDEAQILAVGFMQVATVAQQLGIGGAGIVVGAVELEYIAEFDHRTINVAGFQQGKASKVVLLRALFGGITGDQGKRRCQQHQNENRTS